MTHATTAPRRRGARSRIAARFNWQGTVALLGLAAVWEVLLDTRIVQFEFLPAPSEILSAGFTILVSGALITDTVHTLTSTLVGWVIGSAIACPIEVSSSHASLALPPGAGFLGFAADLKEILDCIVDGIVSVTQCQRGFVMLIESDGTFSTYTGRLQDRRPWP